MELYSRQTSVSVKMLNSNLIVSEAVRVDGVNEIKVFINYSLSEKVICGAKVEFIRFPWNVCPEAASVVSRIVGLNISPGIKKRIKELTGRGDGCSHMSDLITEAVKGLIQARFALKCLDLGGEERVEARINDLNSTCQAFSNIDRLSPCGDWIYARL